LRGGQPLTVRATLDKLDDDDTARPPPRKAPAPGATPQKMAGLEVEDAREGGVRILGVSARHAAGGLQIGDVIVQVGRTPIRNAEQLRQITGQLAPKTTALLKVRRGRQFRFVGLPIDG
jgi:S1-C subfamily serine protease